MKLLETSMKELLMILKMLESEKSHCYCSNFLLGKKDNCIAQILQRFSKLPQTYMEKAKALKDNVF